MSIIIEKFFSNNGTRNDIRKRVINEFMKETPGKGKGNLASKYNYIVESLSSGNNIILKRPANLKNGFDFLIRVENTDFSKGIGKHRDYPKHDDIINDLSLKKQSNTNLYKKLFDHINEIYHCNEIDEFWFQQLNFKIGYPCDLILKTIKWFFIEQDIRYWNYSGRAMLMSCIPI